MTTNRKGTRFIAAAVAAAALVGAGGGAATYAALGSGGTTVRQVTVGSTAEPAATLRNLRYSRAVRLEDPSTMLLGIEMDALRNCA